MKCLGGTINVKLPKLASKKLKIRHKYWIRNANEWQKPYKRLDAFIFFIANKNSHWLIGILEKLSPII